MLKSKSHGKTFVSEVDEIVRGALEDGGYEIAEDDLLDHVVGLVGQLSEADEVVVRGIIQRYVD